MPAVIEYAVIYLNPDAAFCRPAMLGFDAIVSNGSVP